MQRRLKYMDIREILRRLRENHSDRRIARDLNINRRTVQHYRAWALAENLLSGERREKVLSEMGLRVVRFRNDEVKKDSRGTLEKIRSLVA